MNRRWWDSSKAGFGNVFIFVLSGFCLVSTCFAHVCYCLLFLFFVWSFRVFFSWLMPLCQYSSPKFPLFYGCSCLLLLVFFLFFCLKFQIIRFVISTLANSLHRNFLRYTFQFYSPPPPSWTLYIIHQFIARKLVMWLRWNSGSRTLSKKMWDRDGICSRLSAYILCVVYV